MDSASSVSIVAARPVALSARIPGLFLLAFAGCVLYVVGLSPFPRAHNAAHDTRHANGFPCH